jgi:hypothetical protein
MPLAAPSTPMRGPSPGLARAMSPKTPAAPSYAAVARSASPGGPLIRATSPASAAFQ